jgi:hypothetical protein
VAENNTRRVLVPPQGRRRRVLVVEGAPGFEHTFLKRALERDPSLDVDSVVRKGRNDQGGIRFSSRPAAGVRRCSAPGIRWIAARSSATTPSSSATSRAIFSLAINWR